MGRPCQRRLISVSDDRLDLCGTVPEVTCGYGAPRLPLMQRGGLMEAMSSTQRSSCFSQCCPPGGAQSADAPWRRHCDGLHVRLLRKWGGGGTTGRVLKTDLFAVRRTGLNCSRFGGEALQENRVSTGIWRPGRRSPPSRVSPEITVRVGALGVKTSTDRSSGRTTQASLVPLAK